MYLASKLCDNPQLNAERELEEFFPRYFGRAAQPMRQYYREGKKIFWNPANYPAELRNRRILFETRIHRPMMEGRKKFEQRENVRTVPVPKLAVPIIRRKVDGSVDWTRAEKVENLKTLFGKADSMRTEFRIGHDHENLYFRYRESGTPGDPCQTTSGKCGRNGNDRKSIG